MALVRLSKNHYMETSSIQELEIRRDPNGNGGTGENVVFCRVTSGEHHEHRGSEADALLTALGITVEA